MSDLSPRTRQGSSRSAIRGRAAGRATGSAANAPDASRGLPDSPGDRPAAQVFARFRRRPALIGMVHLRALPGTPFQRLSLPEIAAVAVREAALLARAGCDGILLENMHDRPYVRGKATPEIVAGAAVVAAAVRDRIGGGLPIGLQLLAAANREALAVALAAGLDFIRAEGFVFGHVADEGWIEASAAELLRYRRQIGADQIAIWADIQKKHSSHAVTSDLSIGEWAHAAEFFGADAVIVTGAHTGAAASPADLAATRRSTRLPVVVGSGMTPTNAARFATADAWIVGSSIKRRGAWEEEICEQRLADICKSHHKVAVVTAAPATRRRGGRH